MVRYVHLDGFCVQQDPLFPEKQLKDELWNMKAVMPPVGSGERQIQQLCLRQRTGESLRMLLCFFAGFSYLSGEIG